jgi:hypothetical protein
VTGAPARALSATCHAIHIGLVMFVLTGWLVPVTAILQTHIAFVPLLVVTWAFNGNACLLNNIETWLTKGIWRDGANREEGSFLLVAVETYLKLHPTQRQMDIITYALMAVAWALSLAHLSYRETLP